MLSRLITRAAPRVAAVRCLSTLVAAPRVAFTTPSLFVSQSSVSQQVRHQSDFAAGESASADASVGKRENGTVKWFDASKGFGFVVREHGEDLFVHFSGIRGTGYRTLEEGQRVDFVVANGHKGPVAQDVQAKA